MGDGLDSASNQSPSTSPRLSGEGDQFLVAGAVQQNGFAENLGHGGATGRRQLLRGLAPVEQAAFLKLDLDQLMGGQRFVKRSEDGFSQFLAADHDGRAQGMAKSAQEARLLAGQGFCGRCLHSASFNM